MIRKGIQFLFILYFIGLCQEVFAQQKRKVNRFACSLSVHTGQVIPGFTTDQDRWKAGLHFGWGFQVAAEMRVKEHWSVGGGLGLNGFWLNNKGPFDHYIIDFASPTAAAGVQYLWRTDVNKESYIRLNGGIQMGYNDTITEIYEGYTVQISSQYPVFYFARPEVGFRKTTRLKTKSSRFPLQYEWGAYWLYYFNGLGDVLFVEANHQTSARPRGLSLGIFFRMLIPYGNEHTYIKAPAYFYPSVIYHPRSN